MVRRRVPVPPRGAALLPLAALAAPSPATGRALLTEAVTLGYQGRPVRFAAALVRQGKAPVPGAPLPVPEAVRELLALRLATVSERYYQDVPSRGGWIFFGGTARQLRDTVQASDVLLLRLPGRQILYFSARPAMLWSDARATAAPVTTSHAARRPANRGEAKT